MNSPTKFLGALIGVGAACAFSYSAGLRAQQQSPEGGTFESAPGGTRLEVLFDGPSRDVPVEVGILTFAPGTATAEHAHAATEIFFVLEGTLEHVVNGESQMLEPGMLGYVSPPDLVQHVTDPDGPPTRTLVIWSPGGEAPRLASSWQRVAND